MTYNLALKYKGSRNYLQGGDLYNAVLALAAVIFEHGYISSIAFKRFARNQCYLTFTQDNDSVALVAVGVVADLNGGQHDFWVYETADPVGGRYPFDEDSIVRDAVYDETAKSISRIKASAYSPIEDVIALTKKLNYNLFPEVDGKWVFGQLSLAAPLVSGDGLTISMRSCLKGRFSINEIYQGGMFLGSIRFIVGAP